jgi:hypothetical protein
MDRRAENAKVWSSGATSRRDALELARRLERELAALAAEAHPSEHFEFRLAEALAGNLADQLESMAERHAQSSPC